MLMLPVSGSGFLSTPSARRATIGVVLEAAGLEISIHALREEGDEALKHPGVHGIISIHALREEGDLMRSL